MTTPDDAAAAEHAVTPELEPAPEAVGIDVDLIRELATVTDQLKAREGEVKDLKARKAELSEKLLETFELHGMDSIRVDGRNAYVYTGTFPLYREKPVEEGGGRYTAQDAVEALRAIGRGAQVQPETVNHMTMGAILREYRDQNLPIPEVLAKVVELGEKPEVRVGGARK